VSLSFTPFFVSHVLRRYNVGVLGVASVNAKYKKVESLLTKIVALAGIFFVIYALYNIVFDFSGFITIKNLRDFLLPLIFTVLFVPFIYLLALYISYSSIFTRINHLLEDSKLAKYTKWKTIFAFHLNLKSLNEWLQRLALLEANSKNDIRSAIKEMKMNFRAIGATYRVIKSTGLYDSLNVDAKQIATLSVGTILKPVDGKNIIECNTVVEDGVEYDLCNVTVVETGETGYVLKKWIQRIREIDN